VGGGSWFGESLGSGGLGFGFCGVEALAGGGAGFGLVPGDGSGFGGAVWIVAAAGHGGDLGRNGCQPEGWRYIGHGENGR
jgi:hypothetical protein